MRKISSIFVCLIIVLCLSGCARSAERITDHRAVPIQKVIDGVVDIDAAMYRSAFAEDYDKAVSKSFELTEGTAFDDYLKNCILLPAEDAHKLNLGKHYGIEFIVESVEEFTLSNLPENISEYFVDYSDYFVFNYDFNTDSVEKIALINGKMNTWGYESMWDDEKDESVNAKFITFCKGGVWYLHPCYYFTTFN